MEIENQKYRQVVEKAAQLAYKYESKYYACSQTVLAALMEAFGFGDPMVEIFLEGPPLARMLAQHQS